MARHEYSKEDLIAEASGLPNRAELRIPGFDDLVVFGIRNETAVSLYFGDDPVYHWNTVHELRRAHVNGRLMKAENGRLVSLEKQRVDRQVQMVRHEFRPDEQVAFLDEIQTRLDRLASALRSNEVELIRQMTNTSVAMTARIAEWIEQLTCPLAVADKPNVEGKS